jgi:hypothetical protein
MKNFRKSGRVAKPEPVVLNFALADPCKKVVPGMGFKSGS